MGSADPTLTKPPAHEHDLGEYMSVAKYGTSLEDGNVFLIFLNKAEMPLFEVKLDPETAYGVSRALILAVLKAQGLDYVQVETALDEIESLAGFKPFGT